MSAALRAAQVLELLLLQLFRVPKGITTTRPLLAKMTKLPLACQVVVEPSAQLFAETMEVAHRISPRMFRTQSHSAYYKTKLATSIVH
jgi:hypothetical protein